MLGSAILTRKKNSAETWHKIKEKAACDVADGGFLRYKYYADEDTVKLVVAASEVLGISVDDVLHAFGDYFIDYVQDNGYSNVLECLGNNMRDWLSNLNSLHDHLQASYPKGFVAPVFWSEDDPDSSAEEGAILVHYYSQRGTLLVPLVVGILKRIAKTYFAVEVELDQVALQDEPIEGTDGQTHKQTVWRVHTVDPKDAHKLRGKQKAFPRKKSLGDDSTVATATSTTFSQRQNKFKETFKEGGAQASVLRVEELVHRCFFKEDCGLYHALTLEHYSYLIEVWKNANLQKEGRVSTNINGYVGQLCYEVFTLQEDDPSTWPTLKDLPPRIHAETLNPSEFGGKVPETGAYPPSEDRKLQSYPPIVRVTNAVNGDRWVDLTFTPMTDDMSLTMEQQISPQLEEAGISKFDDDTSARIANGELEVRWVICSSTDDKTPYHTFTQGDLSNTTLQQFFDLVAGAKLDPVALLIQVEEAETVADDEEDI